VYARAGRAEKARAVLAELSGDSRVDPTSFAFVHAGLSENDLAFEWLEKGLAERSTDMIYLKHEPEWDPIRDDPRFAELISRISYYTEE